MPRTIKIRSVVEHLNGVATPSVQIDLQGRFDLFNARSLADEITETARRAQDDAIVAQKAADQKALLARINELDKQFPVGAVVRHKCGELADVVPARLSQGAYHTGAIYAYRERSDSDLYVTVKYRHSDIVGGFDPSYLTVFAPADPCVVAAETYPQGTRVCFAASNGDIWFARVTSVPFYSKLSKKVLVHVLLDSGFTISRYADDKLVVVPS